jgi:hypothetical protein
MDGDERLSHPKWSAKAGTAKLQAAALHRLVRRDTFRRVDGPLDWCDIVSRFERLHLFFCHGKLSNVVGKKMTTLIKPFRLLATTGLLLVSVLEVASYAGDEPCQSYQAYQAAQLQLELSGANKLTLEQVDRINAQHHRGMSSADGYFVVDPIRGLPALVAHKALYRYYTSERNQSFTFDFGDRSCVVLGPDNYLPAHDCFPPNKKTLLGCLGSFSVGHIYGAAGTYTAAVKNASGIVVDSLTVYIP